MTAPRGSCPVCLRRYSLRRDGTLPRHGDLAGPPVAPYDDNTCAGSGSRPSAPVLRPGLLVDCDGHTHVIRDGDALVCGWATADAADVEGEEHLRWTAATAPRPTCSACLRVIAACRPWVRL
jgi:hypothetical protein